MSACMHAVNQEGDLGVQLEPTAVHTLHHFRTILSQE